MPSRNKTTRTTTKSRSPRKPSRSRMASRNSTVHQLERIGRTSLFRLVDTASGLTVCPSCLRRLTKRAV